jgi:hypothetical protein
MGNRIVALFSILICSVAWGQAPGTPSTGTQSGGQQSMPGMDMPGMSGHEMSKMKDTPMGTDKDDSDASDASVHVMNSMEGHMDMGPHMKMTALRQSKPGDAARAHEVA